MTTRNAAPTAAPTAASNAQLSLIETPRVWRLDERTRAVGRAGIARARAALRDGRHTRTADPPGERRKRAAA